MEEPVRFGVSGCRVVGVPLGLGGEEHNAQTSSSTALKTINF